MANFKAIVFKDGYTLADGTVLEAFVASLLNCNIATSASNINELTKRLKAVIIEEYEYITYQNMEPLGNSVPAKYFAQWGTYSRFFRPRNIHRHSEQHSRSGNGHCHRIRDSGNRYC